MGAVSSNNRARVELSAGPLVWLLVGSLIGLLIRFLAGFLAGHFKGVNL